MHVRRIVVAAACLLTLSRPAGCSGSAALHAYQDRLWLLKLTLSRDVQWSPVLRRKVLLPRDDPLHRAAYHETDLLRLMDQSESAVAPGPLIRRVVREFAWLGSARPSGSPSACCAMRTRATRTPT